MKKWAGDGQYSERDGIVAWSLGNRHGLPAMGEGLKKSF